MQAIQGNGSKLSQISDLRIWDSLTKWVRHIEEFLFYSSPATSSTSSLSFDNPLRLNVDNEGRWKWFSLAQQVSDLLDILIAKSFTLSSTATYNVQKQVQEPLMRLHLHIICATIHEADRFGSREKIAFQNQQLNVLQNSVASFAGISHGKETRQTREGTEERGREEREES